MSPAHRLVGFFDGASQVDSSRCGIGAVLKLDDLSYYHLWLNYSPRSNTKGELLSLWILLCFSELLGMDGIHIFGDPR